MKKNVLFLSILLLLFSSYNMTNFQNNDLQHNQRLRLQTNEVLSQTEIKLDMLDENGDVVTIINGVNNSNTINTYASTNSWNIVSKNYETNQLLFEYFNPDNYSMRTSILNNDSDHPTNEGYNPIPDNKISSRIIIDGDDRTIINNTTDWPYRATGYLETTYYVLNNLTGNYDRRSFIGSAFLEGPDLLVTAGHCVYGDVSSSYTDSNGITKSEYDDYINNPVFASEIVFYPAKNGSYNPYGGINVKKVFLENHYYLNLQKDWACCQLEMDIGNNIGWYGKIGSFYQTNYDIVSYGYPGSGGGYMYLTSGKMTYFEDNGWYFRTLADVEGGQSGSPVFVVVNGISYVFGIMTYSTQTYNGGFRFDNFVYEFLNSFVTNKYHNYCTLSVVGKSGSTWYINITNNCSDEMTIYYNSKMCFESDAKNWTGLTNIETKKIMPNTSAQVNISTNLFATHITCSFITTVGNRWVSYATNLNNNNKSLTQYNNIIAA